MVFNAFLVNFDVISVGIQVLGLLRERLLDMLHQLLRVWGCGLGEGLKSQISLRVGAILLFGKTIEHECVVDLKLVIEWHLRESRLSFQVAQLFEHLLIRIYLLVVLIDLSIFDPHNLVSIRKKVLSSLEAQGAFIEFVLELTSSLRLLLEPELMLLDIAFELLDGLLGIFEVCLFRIHFFNELVILGLVDSQQILLMSSLLLFLLQLPLFVVDALIRGINLNSKPLDFLILLFELLLESSFLIFEKNDLLRGHEVLLFRVDTFDLSGMGEMLHLDAVVLVHLLFEIRGHRALML